MHLPKLKYQAPDPPQHEPSPTRRGSRYTYACTIELIPIKNILLEREIGSSTQTTPLYLKMRNYLNNSPPPHNITSTLNMVFSAMWYLTSPWSLFG